MERPVFVFASGWRTGSTLLQRVLTSHSEIMIWGENRGAILDLQRARHTLAGLQGYSGRHTENFSKEGTSGWIPTMNPSLERFDEGIRRLLEVYYKEPAGDLGKGRWGFKEVRCGMETAGFLQALFPDARFLFLVRNPADCLASARSLSVPLLLEGVLHESGGPVPFLEHWRNLATSFLDQGGRVEGLVVRYEDLVADRDGELARIAGFLGTEVDRFDREVLDVRRRGGLGLPPRLTREDRESLKCSRLWEVAARFGYRPDPA